VNRRLREGLLTLPSLVWLGVFFIIPAALVLVISFRNADLYGGIAPGWSLAAYFGLQPATYLAILARTVWLSLLTTVICLLLGIPVAYSLARMPAASQQSVLLMLVVPFWTNFLIRIYAWKVLLHPDGSVKQLFAFLGLVGQNATLLYTPGAVLTVLVYTYLPFAILPLYAAAEKFDFSLIEAARDLGAPPLRAFLRVFLPGISAGVISAVMVVFIPALGSYIIPEIVGGPGGEMLGNKIAQRAFLERNLPRASALSTVLMLMILLPSVVSLRLGRGRDTVGGAVKGLF
jgi:ABC-type spermidine/putrescine transport system permease subunit I